MPSRNGLSEFTASNIAGDEKGQVHFFPPHSSVIVFGLTSTHVVRAMRVHLKRRDML